MTKYVRSKARIKRREYGPDLLLTSNELKDWFSSFRLGDFYVYVLHTKDGIPFYVGKSRVTNKRHRVLEHLSCRKAKKPLYKFINEQSRIYVSIHMFTSLEYLALVAEGELISVHGRRLDGGILFNVSTGGQKGPTGVPKSLAIRRKLSQAHKGKIVSEETRKKISLSSSGRKHSESTKFKLREIARKRKESGYTISEATRRRIRKGRKSEKAQRQLRSLWVSIEIDGVEYASYAEASRCLDIGDTTLYYRVSQGFPGYRKVA